MEILRPRFGHVYFLMALHVSKSWFSSCMNYMFSYLFYIPKFKTTRAISSLPTLGSRWQVLCPVSVVESWSGVSCEAELEVFVVRQ